MQFKDLKLDELPQDEQIVKVRDVLRGTDMDAVRELIDDAELAGWLEQNKDRIVEFANEWDS